MKFMILVKATKDSEAGKMPTESLLLVKEGRTDESIRRASSAGEAVELAMRLA